jgi:hypothetical protein
MMNFNLNNLYRYDKKNVTYRKVSTIKSIIFLTIYTVVISSWSYYEGYDSGLDLLFDVVYGKEKYKTKEIVDPTKNKVWVDETFAIYKKKADMYLSRDIFRGTPLNGELLSHCARNTYESTGKLVPLELVLAQAQWESGMGREGRSPVNNPFNVGEYDTHTAILFESTMEGTQRYYDLMAKHYLKCRTTEELLFEFVNCGGKRYASSDYELHVGEQYYYVKKWFKANLND